MNFLHDPTWQFIITLNISILTIIVSVVTAVIIYKRQKNRKAFSWQIEANFLLFYPPDVIEQVVGKLQILLEGKPVNDLRLIIFKIWNSGNTPIGIQDYENSTPGLHPFYQTTGQVKSPNLRGIL